MNVKVGVESFVDGYPRTEANDVPVWVMERDRSADLYQISANKGDMGEGVRGNESGKRNESGVTPIGEINFRGRCCS